MYGYASAGSRPSLIAGSVIGLGLLASGYLNAQGEPAGQYMATAFGSILALSMGRKATTLAPIPVVFTAVGASVAAYYAVSIYNRNSSVL